MKEYDYDYIADIVSKAQQGDSDAFAELYALSYEKQYRFACRYLNDAFLAQDVLQEVYILVLKNLDKLKKPRLFISWVDQITFRVCYDMGRKLKTVPEPVDDEVLECSPSPRSDPEELLLESAGSEQMKQMLLSLPPKESKAITLCCLKNMRQEDAAELMGCSLSSLKRYIVRGREHMKELMGKEA